MNNIDFVHLYEIFKKKKKSEEHLSYTKYYAKSI